MPSKFLHEHKNFADLLRILEKETGILAGLIEKDYWIMHVLYGLKKQGFSFVMKGGTSLSKGYGIIDRFSEDIDIQIYPPDDLGVVSNPKNIKGDAVDSRRQYYDWLAEQIKIEGITSILRDKAFDNEKTYNSGGIRLFYESSADKVEGAKEGILLEVGFDTVTPNNNLRISSWAYERAVSGKIKIEDNRAIDIACYHPGYTFVEKLQTIVTKFRIEQEKRQEKPNLMRQYYDIYCLLDNPLVQEFIGTDDYQKHKEVRFTGKDKGVFIAENEAFHLSSPELQNKFKERYEATKSLYYKGQPPFEELLQRIKKNIERL
ncbi:nucleotidyl transferase AbiEii/AbiGii toxin family protein [Chitinophaga sp. HK235]|uniref:nucleotidyl transferase AbiEii/AbiGii toxin family protein n=1 Tax=Chitinophaga sp. HK235 TaxID=2952571 RepID=UPI001BA6B32E|nr:nucleotidyl transferase AbiEii/AbiGii toxin family protein [Chitinophaga sp. HK235]